MQGRSPESTNAVAGFIDRSNGDLYKPATYARPAPHIRFTGEELMSTALEAADPYGSYLYL